jgi:hypothetical protein
LSDGEPFCLEREREGHVRRERLRDRDGGSERRWTMELLPGWDAGCTVVVGGDGGA